jgi:hypothetical protein
MVKIVAGLYCAVHVRDDDAVGIWFGRILRVSGEWGEG